MTTLSTIFLTVIIVVLLLLAAFLFFPKESENTVNVHIDDKAGVRIMRAMDGIRLDIIYETYDERQEDPGLFPDIVNDVAPKGDADRDFWIDVVSLNELSVERREEVVRRLHALGWIQKEKMVEFIMPPDEREEGEAPDPEEVDPADTKAFDAAYPADKDADKAADEEFVTFNI